MRAGLPLESALRKARWRILPLLSLGYLVAYTDRVNISFAAEPMNRDLHFSPHVYGLGAGLFFVSYALCEVPSNWLLLKFGARRWLARIMLTWGAAGDGDAVRARADELLWHEAAAGCGGGGVLSGRGLLSVAVVSGEGACAGDQLVLCVAAAGERRDGSGGRSAAAAGWTTGSAWMAVAVPGGRDAGGAAERRDLVHAVGETQSGEVAAAKTSAKRWSASWQMRHPSEEHSHGWDAAAGSAARWARVAAWDFARYACSAAFYAENFFLPEMLRGADGSVGSEGRVSDCAGRRGGSGGDDRERIAFRPRRERRWHVIVPVLMIALLMLIAGLHLQGWAAAVVLLMALAVFFAMQAPWVAIVTELFRGEQAALAIATVNMLGIIGGFLGPYWMGWMRELTGGYAVGLGSLCVPWLVMAGRHRVGDTTEA